jgi:GNAT superfamily N-acetyltransferase
MNQLRNWMRLMENDTSATDVFEDVFAARFAASSYAAKGHLYLHAFGPRDVEITHIGVDSQHRNQGVGNALMAMVTDLADQHQIVLYASPATDAGEDGGPDQLELREWYERWDFVKLPGRDLMMREPFDED